jgi:hypothetical protein
MKYLTAITLMITALVTTGTKGLNGFHAEEQKYIVRYGTTCNYGAVIVTEDGNEWTLIDAPEYENGTEVRVLFDSRETKNVTDDIIIDVTERN